MINIEEVKDYIKEIYPIYDEKQDVIFLNADLKIEFMKNSIDIIFWEFENTFFSFNYCNSTDMSRAVVEFLDILYTKTIKIVESYYYNKLYQRVIYYQSKKDSWEKITSSKKLGFFKRKKYIEIVETIIKPNKEN